jgi:hypothetical protein
MQCAGRTISYGNMTLMLIINFVVIGLMHTSVGMRSDIMVLSPWLGARHLQHTLASYDGVRQP